MKKSRQNSSNKKGSDRKQYSNLTRQKLIDFLMRSAQVERKLQIIKEMLAEEQDFTAASLFHRIDSQRKGYIVEENVKEFTLDQNLHFKGSEIKILFGRINVEKQSSQVHVREFQNFILPNQNPRLRYFTVRRPVIVPIPKEPLSQKIEWITAKLFTQIITQYSKLMEIHHALLSTFDFDAPGIFKTISQNGQIVTGEDLQAFMTTNKREISQEQIGCLLRTIDKRGEGHIYIQDFKYFLATLGLKKQHEIFDQLSPIPALKSYIEESYIKKIVKDRDSTLKERYKDNKSYLKGNDEIPNNLGHSQKMDNSRGSGWLSNSRKMRK